MQGRRDDDGAVQGDVMVAISKQELDERLGTVRRCSQSANWEFRRERLRWRGWGSVDCPELLFLFLFLFWKSLKIEGSADSQKRKSVVKYGSNLPIRDVWRWRTPHYSAVKNQRECTNLVPFIYFSLHMLYSLYLL
jgi:hypothetical protein